MLLKTSAGDRQKFEVFHHLSEKSGVFWLGIIGLRTARLLPLGLIGETWAEQLLHIPCGWFTSDPSVWCKTRSSACQKSAKKLKNGNYPFQSSSLLTLAQLQLQEIQKAFWHELFFFVYIIHKNTTTILEGAEIELGVVESWFLHTPLSTKVN